MELEGEWARARMISSSTALLGEDTRNYLQPALPGATASGDVGSYTYGCLAIAR